MKHFKIKLKNMQMIVLPIIIAIVVIAYQSCINYNIMCNCPLDYNDIQLNSDQSKCYYVISKECIHNKLCVILLLA